MAKSAGMGQRFYIGGYGATVFAYDLSGDIGTMDNCHGGPAPLDITAINASAMERIGGVRDGGMDWTAFFNAAISQEHEAFSRLPSGDVLAMYLASTTVGDPVACLYGPTPNYAGKRGANGSLLFSVPMQGDGYGLEWCQLLKAKSTDASARNGASIDYGAASTLFGASCYVVCFSLSSGSMLPEIQDSADNSTFAAISGMTLGTVTTAGANAAQRVQSATGATIRRYVRIASTGSFTNASVAAAFIRHLTATL